MVDPVSAAGAAALTPKAAAGIAAGGAVLEAGLSSAFNAWQANKSMRFQERMSNTSHQREVLDLQKAGLNPILSAKYGGSSTPPGAQAQSVPSQGTAKAIEAALAKGQMSVQQATVDDLNSAAALKRAQAADVTITQQSRIDEMIARAQETLSRLPVNSNMAEKILQEIKNLKAQKELIKSQTDHSAAQLHKEQVKALPWEAAKSAVETWKDRFNKAREWIKKDPVRQWWKKRKGGK